MNNQMLLRHLLLFSNSDNGIISPMQGNCCGCAEGGGCGPRSQQKAGVCPSDSPAFVQSQGICPMSPRIARQVCQELDTFPLPLAHIAYLPANLVMSSHAEWRGTLEHMLCSACPFSSALPDLRLASQRNLLCLIGDYCKCHNRDQI